MTALTDQEKERAALTKEIDADVVAKIIFLHFDPILRVVLTLIRQYQALCSKNEQDQQKPVVKVLQAIAKALDNLRHAIETIFPDLPKATLGDGLVALLDYISLPLLVMLRLSEGNWARTDDERGRVLRSAIWKCGEKAAGTLIVLLYRIQAGKASIKASVIVKSLVVCASALPSGPEVAQEFGSGSIDHGDGCLIELLKALAVIIRLPCDDRRALRKEISDAMHGTLVARVVDMVAAVIAHKRRGETAAGVVGLEMLVVWMERVPLAHVWRKVFPGLFPALYRSLLNALKSSKAKIALAALPALCELLILTLTIQMEKVFPVAASMNVLQSLASQANSKITDNDAVRVEPCEEEIFFQQVNNRLPAPLTILVQFLASNSSAAIRKCAVNFYRVILIDAHGCWESETREKILSATLESCLILANDEEVDVAMVATLLRDAYVAQAGNTMQIPSKIVPLLKELPILAQGHKTTELGRILRLLSGYLSLATTTNIVNKHFRTSLSVMSVAAAVRRAFATLFDVNFDGAENRLVVAAVMLTSEKPSRPNNPRLMYLDEKLERVATATVHLFAKALGERATVLFIDDVVADLYQSCVSRAESWVNPVGPNQVEWLHEWVGAVRLIKELVIGGFGHDAGVDSVRASKVRRDRLALRFATAVLPIITASPLWDLPLAPVRNPNPTKLSTLAATESSLAASDERVQLWTASSLEGNASLSYMLMSFIAALVDILEKSSREVLLLVLYPLLEKLGDGASMLVRDMSMFTLRRLALVVGYPDVAGMLSDNFSSLMGVMVGRLRIPGGGSLLQRQLADASTLSVVSTATTLCRCAELDSTEHGGWLANLQQVVDQLLDRFDHIMARGSREEVEADAFTDLFLAALWRTHTTYLRSVDVKRSCTTKKLLEPWFAFLDDFRSDSYKASLRIEDCVPESTNAQNSSNVALTGVDEVELVARISDRCVYLLSHSSLKIQIKSSAALVDAYAILSDIAEFHPETDESNGPKTAIFRRVASLWPTVLARMRALVQSLTASTPCILFLSSVPVPLAKQSNSGGPGEMRLFLASLFDLIGVMTSCSGDFMATRFKEFVWPLIASVLRDVLGSPSLRKTSRTGSEQKLLESVFRCLRRTFEHREAGRALSGLITSIAYVVLPFVDDAELAKSSMDLLKTLALVDCDALWRPLLETCGACDTVQCPIVAGLARSTAQIQTTPALSNTVSTNLLELKHFINELPEQPLFD